MDVDRQSDNSDAALIRLSRRDSRAFDELFVRHAGDIRNYFASRVDSHDGALDLTAEVFAQAWINRRRFEPPPDGSAGPWLQGIAKNLYRQWAKGRKLEAAACRKLGIETSATIEDDADDRLDAARIGPGAMERLASLPHEQREAISLRVLQELPYDVVATRMRCTPELARVRVSRGLRSIGIDMGAEST